jgi:hypothetical protein
VKGTQICHEEMGLENVWMGALHLQQKFIKKYEANHQYSPQEVL